MCIRDRVSTQSTGRHTTQTMTAETDRPATADAATKELPEEIISDPRLRAHIGAQRWDYGDVGEWLGHLNLEQYKAKFMEYGIDGPILMEMKKEDWELLGVSDKKHLQKINNSMAKLRTCKTVDQKTYWVPTRLMPQPKREELDALSADLDSWACSMKQTDVELLCTKPQDDGASAELPPVRGQGAQPSKPLVKPVVQPAQEPTQKPAGKQGAGKHTYDYFDQWDKFDVDDELEKLDTVLGQSTEQQDLSDDDDDEESNELPPELERLSGVARTQAGLREKEMGNEYTKSAEWSKAVRHYNRSLVLQPGVGAVYANRALANIKQKKFNDAERDCDLALLNGADPTKAHFRRGVARKQLKKWEAARQDFETVLSVEPEQKEAHKELSAVKKQLGIGKKGGRRIKIEEVSQQELSKGGFEAASSYAGSRAGKVFQMGSQGLGYYRDKMLPPPAQAKDEEVLEEVSTEGAKAAELEEAMQAVAQEREAKKKRSLRRRRS
eukprot:TRINITY_DN1379_c0_g1_i18.p1 TRINITY_DN1379_c0_g1~~TRINITY_DN1379_c0_g1_i18.p1  ORF type:complete len:496 (+),score=198.67 TRINITY_DN1379_c0_g1_i18:198-1685(+)